MISLVDVIERDHLVINRYANPYKDDKIEWCIGRVDPDASFFPLCWGETIDEVLENLKDMLNQ